MENLTISMTDAILLDLISDKQLVNWREKHKDNPQVVAIIDGRLEAKAKADTDAKAMTEFKELLNSVDLPNPPDGVYNVYTAYGKVFRLLNEEEKVALLATHPELTQDIVDNRQVETDEWAWSGWTLNKAMSQAKASTTTRETATRKLAITLLKRDGTNLEAIGNFPTSKSACVYLNFETGKDSARRVLEAKGYIVDSYDGTDFLVQPE